MAGRLPRLGLNEGGTGDRVRSTLKFVEYLRWVLDEWIPFVTSAYPDERPTA